MAEATRVEKIVTTTEARYTLEMTEEEFRFLMDLLGNQIPDAGNGAGGRIWDALKDPKAGTTEPETFSVNERVTVLYGARSANGSPLYWDGPATVSFGPDSDVDYFVRSDNSRECGYVLPQYLTRR